MTTTAARSRRWLLVLALLITTGLAISFTRWSSANAQLDTARRATTDLDAQLTELVSLRGATTLDGGASDDRDSAVLEWIATITQASGIPARSLRSITPESRGPAPSRADSTTPTRPTRKVITTTLDSISLPQLGAWLATWSTAHPHWTPSTIALTKTAATTDEAFTATITLTSVQVLKGDR